MGQLVIKYRASKSSETQEVRVPVDLQREDRRVVEGPLIEELILDGESFVPKESAHQENVCGRGS